jgi:hypothetical protein
MEDLLAGQLIRRSDPTIGLAYLMTVKEPGQIYRHEVDTATRSSRRGFYGLPYGLI